MQAATRDRMLDEPPPPKIKPEIMTTTGSDDGPLDLSSEATEPMDLSNDNPLDLSSPNKRIRLSGPDDVWMTLQAASCHIEKGMWVPIQRDSYYSLLSLRGILPKEADTEDSWILIHISSWNQ